MGLYDYYPETQVQPPNVLGSLIQGSAAAQGLQQGQQELQMGGLKMDQLRMALRGQQAYLDAGQQMLSGQTSGAGAPSVGRTGGIQNGPQDAVAGTATGGQSPVGGWLGGGGRPQTSGFMPSPQNAYALELLKMGAGGAGDPIAAAQKAQDYAVKQSQFQWSSDPGFSGEAFQRLMATSPDADKTLKANWDQLKGPWAQIALQLGVDARDTSLHNVNKVAAAIYNQNAISRQMPPIAAPAAYKNLYGPNGQLVQQEVDTGKENEVIGQKLPTYSMQDTGYDPGTGKTGHQLMVTSPGGAPAPGAPGGGGRGPGVGSPAGQSFSTYAAPTEANIKQAGFAATMLPAVQKLRQLESQGIALSPAQRTQLIDMATNEDPSLLHSFLSQEALQKWGPQAKQYLTAMMPVIQAVSHDQAGARVTTSQLRLNLESVIPVDPKDKGVMEEVNRTRDEFQKTMNVGAGSAAFTPEFNQSVGAQRRQSAAGGSAPAAAIEHLKANPALAPQFKAKYGYLPQ